VSATAEEVIKYARKFAGKVTEDPPGSNTNRFTRQYGVNGIPWCAVFVWCVLNHFKVPILKTAYTPTMADYFKDQKRGFADDSKAKLGDVVFFDFPDSLHRIQHVGFVTDGPKLLTVEGNTSSGSSGSQDDGGGVFTRDRGPIEAVYYGRPKYKDVKELPKFDFPKAKAWFGFADRGADVKLWQLDLNRWVKNLKKKDFDFRLEITKEFDTPTLKATKTFQHSYGLDVDGRVGKHTIEVMERIRDRQKAA
jgi:hypothetical protein